MQLFARLVGSSEEGRKRAWRRIIGEHPQLLEILLAGDESQIQDLRRKRPKFNTAIEVIITWFLSDMSLWSINFATVQLITGHHTSFQCKHLLNALVEFWNANSRASPRNYRTYPDTKSLYFTCTRVHRCFKIMLFLLLLPVATGPLTLLHACRKTRTIEIATTGIFCWWIHTL